MATSGTFSRAPHRLRAASACGKPRARDPDPEALLYPLRQRQDTKPEGSRLDQGHDGLEWRLTAVLLCRTGRRPPAAGAEHEGVRGASPALAAAHAGAAGCRHWGQQRQWRRRGQARRVRVALSAAPCGGFGGVRTQPLSRKLWEPANLARRTISTDCNDIFYQSPPSVATGMGIHEAGRQHRAKCLVLCRYGGPRQRNKFKQPAPSGVGGKGAAQRPAEGLR